MGEVVRLKPKKRIVVERKKVAAYARVSTAQERQEHSFAAQVSYYSELIQSNPEWEYAGVYSDEGISGTSIKKRDGFQQMISDAEAGKIDIILTKSISRFARNTVDLLESVRHLKDLGIEVRFEKENISSLSADGELMLTILASFAQEESSSQARNIRWGIRRKFERGEHWGKPPFGYDSEYRVVENEAETVRMIFDEFLHDVPLRQIARETNKSVDFVRKALFNEAYIGNILLQKRYASEIRQSQVNDGQLPQYYVTGHHEPIVTDETFQAVQMKIKESYEFNPEAHRMVDVRWYTAKFTCASCGSHFVKIQNDCITCLRKKNHGKKECKAGTINLEKIKPIIREVLGWEEFSETSFTSTVENVLVEADGTLIFTLYDGTKRKAHYHFFKNEDLRHNDRHRKVFGYDWKDGYYHINKEEADAVRMLFDEYMAGATVKELSGKMVSLGFNSKNGGFSCDVVRAVLKNSFYTGARLIKAAQSGTGKDELISDDHKAIITEEELKEARRRLWHHGSGNKDTGKNIGSRQ